jgi:hypothetical protein
VPAADLEKLKSGAPQPEVAHGGKK